MSWQKTLLNPYLAATERPHMARAKNPQKLRRAFEAKARIFFHAPFGTRMSESKLGDLNVLRVRPRHIRSDAQILYFHGGGYVFGSPRTHAAMLARLALACGCEAVLPWYPLAPEHPFPAAQDAARQAWEALSAEIPSNRIILGGDSAGGGLALSLLGVLCYESAPLPAGTFAFSPLTDMTYSGLSMTENAASDVVLPAERVHEFSDLVLPEGQDPRDPRASPLYAGFEGASPIWLTAATKEILRDDTIRLAAHLEAKGVEVTSEILENLPHVWPIFHNILPEAWRSLDRLGHWITLQTTPRGES